MRPDNPLFDAVDIALDDFDNDVESLRDLMIQTKKLFKDNLVNNLITSSHLRMVRASAKRIVFLLNEAIQETEKKDNE